MSAKLALIIANIDYADPKLAKLTAPSKDAEAFAAILKAADLAAFDDVTTIINGPEPIARRSIAKFFSGRQPDDLLLLYFSGHGVRDDQGRLYLAMTDTDSSMLDGTAVPSDFVTRQMDNSRSKRQVLILDCCNSGAFAVGTKAAIGASMGTASAFEGAGYGRIVLTATDATQFAWEGDKVIGEGTTNSLFTHFLVKGLEGEADTNGDGTITVDELYDYAYSEIVKRTPKQTPGKWTYKEQGQIVLTNRVKPQTVKPLPLDPDLEESLLSPRNFVREAAVNELNIILHGPNLGRALSAELRLQYVAENDDSRIISRKAAQLLEEYRASRAVASPVQTNPPAGQEQSPQTSAGTEAEEAAPRTSALPSLEEANRVQPAANTRAVPLVPNLRKYAAIAAIGVAVLGVIGLAWWALGHLPASPSAPSPAIQPTITTSSKSTSTVAGILVPPEPSATPQLGTWGIDYFSNVQLSEPAAYHTNQSAQPGTDGRLSLQIKSAELRSNPKIPASNFSARLSGLFYFSGGTYELRCEHQDGCRVFVDGESWIDAWEDGPGSHDVARYVPAGNHIVRVEFYDKSGEGLLSVGWVMQPLNTPSPTLTSTSTSTPTIVLVATPTKKKKSGGGPTQGICLAFDTRIDTPLGSVPVEDLRVGDLVWTQDASGVRVAMPILKTGHVPVPAGFKILHLILSDGRQAWVSPSHPLADGSPVADLTPGDWLDGARVTQVESVPYSSSYTYDILPAGPTGLYWADGILLGSTLKSEEVP